MAKRNEIEAFILNANITNAQKKGLNIRLKGLALDGNEILDERQISMIFEGMPSLKNSFYQR